MGALVTVAGGALVSGHTGHRFTPELLGSRPGAQPDGRRRYRVRTKGRIAPHTLDARLTHASRRVAPHLRRYRHRANEITRVWRAPPRRSVQKWGTSSPARVRAAQRSSRRDRPEDGSTRCGSPTTTNGGRAGHSPFVLSVIGALPRQRAARDYGVTARRCASIRVIAQAAAPSGYAPGRFALSGARRARTSNPRDRGRKRRRLEMPRSRRAHPCYGRRSAETRGRHYSVANAGSTTARRPPPILCRDSGRGEHACAERAGSAHVAERGDRLYRRRRQDPSRRHQGGFMDDADRS